jgi:hypothetical protein
MWHWIYVLKANKKNPEQISSGCFNYLLNLGRVTSERVAKQCFDIAIDFSQKSPHFSLLSPTSPCELSERKVTSPSNLKVVGALDNYSLVFVIFINFFGQLKDWVGQVLFLVSCPKGQVEKYVNVEACNCLRCSYLIKMKCRIFVMDLPNIFPVHCHST